MRKTFKSTKSRLALKIWSDGSASWELALGGKGRSSISRHDILKGLIIDDKKFSSQSRLSKFRRKFKI